MALNLLAADTIDLADELPIGAPLANASQVPCP
jgi:hypothetical protein